MQTVGYALYIAALSDAPVSLVAVMMQGGIALFVIFAVVFLHEQANAREWAGIVGILVAMVVLGLSLTGGAAGSEAKARALWIFSAVSVGAAAAPFMLCAVYAATVWRPRSRRESPSASAASTPSRWPIRFVVHTRYQSDAADVRASVALPR